MLWVTAAVALLGASCGGGKGQGPAGAPSPPPSPSAAPQAQGCPASAGLPPSANDHGPKAALGPDASIEAEDTFFTPTCLTGVPPGEFALAVHNAGAALHNISVPDQGIDMDVEPGQSVTVHVKVAGVVVPFFCKYHRASGMVGSLVAQA